MSKVLASISLALIVTVIVGVASYAMWDWAGSDFGEYVVAITLDGEYEACGVNVGRNIELAGYNLDEIFSQEIDCESSGQLCFLNCLKNGGLPDRAGGCYHSCGWQ